MGLTTTPIRRLRTGSRLATAVMLACGLLLTSGAFATDGTQLIGVGALQKGTGGAGVASPQDMTWVLLNPASIIDMGCRLDLNVEYFAPKRSNEPHGLFSNARADEMWDKSPSIIPSLGYSRSCGCGDEAWGLGLYGVSGMGVDYEKARSGLPTIFLQNYDRRTQYSVVKLAFGYAHTIPGDWVVGIAPHINYAMFKTDMLTLNFRQAEAHNDWDEAYGIGFAVGLYKRWDRFGVGATYTSRQWMTEFKDYDDLFFESMDLPQMLQVGFAYDITPSLELVADYKWINWGGVDQMAKEPWRGGFGWEDQHIIKGGLTWYATPKWTFRTGFSHSKSPISEEHVFANSLFPAITEDHVSVGFSYAMTEKSDIHVTYMHAFKNELEDSGTGDIFSMVGRGSKISLEEDTVTLEYSYKFQLGSCMAKRLEWKQEQYEKKKGEGRF